MTEAEKNLIIDEANSIKIETFGDLRKFVNLLSPFDDSEPVHHCHIEYGIHKTPMTTSKRFSIDRNSKSYG